MSKKTNCLILMVESCGCIFQCNWKVLVLIYDQLKLQIYKDLIMCDGTEEAIDFMLIAYCNMHLISTFLVWGTSELWSVVGTKTANFVILWKMSQMTKPWAKLCEHNVRETYWSGVVFLFWSQWLHFGRNTELLVKYTLDGWGRQREIACGRKRKRVRMRLYKHLTFWINSNAQRSWQSMFCCIWEILK